MPEKNKWMVFALIVLSIVCLALLNLYWQATIKYKNTKFTLQMSADTILAYKVLAQANYLFFDKNYPRAIEQYVVADSLLNNQNFSKKAYRYFADNQLINDSLIKFKKNIKNLKSTMGVLGAIHQEHMNASEKNWQQIRLFGDTVQLLKSKNRYLADSLVYYQNLLETLSKSFGRLAFENSKGAKIQYIGYLKNNKAHGYGVGLYDNYSVYEGYWQDNMRWGKGKHRWTTGEVYEGEFKEDKKHGYGVYTFGAGEKYQGYWANDVREGFGTLYDADGGIMIEGNWKADRYVRKSEH